MQVSTMGIIIRQRSVGDDRWVTILTRDRGVLGAFARGAKNPRGKLCAASELFCYSRMNLFAYRDRVTLDSAEIEAPFFELRQDLTAFSLASYIAELCCELAPKEEEAPEYLRLVLNCLQLLKTNARPAPLLKAIFELRLLTMAGYMPDLTGCARCGEYAGDSMRFCIESGELLCGRCAAEPDTAMILPSGVLAAMRHILYSDFEKLFSFSLSR
ncbi:MAG: DNA repair protein RecO, partial [Oscillospiraceae bacterium]